LISSFLCIGKFNIGGGENDGIFYGGVATSPALLAVGWIIGPKISSFVFVGGLLGESGQKEVYELHDNVVKPTIFDIIATSERYPQAIKHPESPLYGVLFHPEVRNKHMISYFIEKI